MLHGERCSRRDRRVFKEGRLSYADFVWFLISEEDKKTDTRWGRLGHLQLSLPDRCGVSSPRFWLPPGYTGACVWRASSVEYWFRCMDLDGDGVLSMYELEFFYEEQCQKLEAMAIEPLPFEDCLCQMLDLVKPEVEGQAPPPGDAQPGWRFFLPWADSGQLPHGRVGPPPYSQ